LARAAHAVKGLQVELIASLGGLVSVLFSEHVTCFLANIDASYGDCGVEFRRHSVLLVFGAPCRRNLLAGQEHGRTIPLSDLSRSGFLQRTLPKHPHFAGRGFLL